jgi:uncharacterized protein YkwD
MRLSVPAFCFALIAACTSVPLQLPTPGRTAGGGTSGGATPGGAAVAEDVVRHTNEARTRNGLPAFRTNAKLIEAARIHAEQMASAQRAAHTISGARYPTMQDRINAVAYAYMQIAENVAWNQRSAQDAVESWMSSSGHRANILDPGLTEIGTAMARSSRGEPYWIQVFGRPR